MMFFARYASPIPVVMWFCSYCYAMVAYIIRWRLNRAFQLTQPLPRNYEPSTVQTSTRHPSLIDWLAIGGMRDRLIQQFNDSTRIDQIFIDIMAHMVVEVEDISTILTDVDAGPGFLGVWNIFNAMTGGAGSADIQPSWMTNSLELHDYSLTGLYHLHESLVDTNYIGTQTSRGKGPWAPIPLMTLLSSPQSARQLYHHLELYNAHRTWKIDPILFIQYPKLMWDGCESVIASGKSFRVSSSWLAAGRTSNLVI
jgi:hypothetical protein